eukprot:UN07393
MILKDVSTLNLIMNYLYFEYRLVPP